MLDLMGLQQDVYDRFRKCVANVPEQVACVETGMEPWPDDLGGGEVLRLRLAPTDPRTSLLEIYVREGLCEIHYGRHGIAQWGFGDGYESAPDAEEIEQYMRAVLQGQVSETLWTRKGKFVRAKTRIRLDSREVLSDWSDAPQSAMGLVLRDVERIQVDYEPYPH